MLPANSAAIGSLSPSRLDRLACPARVAFEQMGDAGGATGGSTAAALGTAVHGAMEHLLAGEAAGDAWKRACDDLAVSGPDPRSLPGARRAAIRFKRQSPTLLAIVASTEPSSKDVEQVLRSADGELAGTPDLVLISEHGLVVVDHKTSVVAEDGVVRPHYERQVRIYAGLAVEWHSRPVTRGVLLSTRQGAVEVEVTPGLVGQALAEARQARADYNSRAPGPQPASPGEEQCRWCPYRARCDAFWEEVDPSWVEEVGECTRATVLGAPEVAADGRAALPVRTRSGPMPIGEQITIAEVPEQLVADVQAGDAVAVTGLHRRDGIPNVARWTQRSSLWRSPASA